MNSELENTELADRFALQQSWWLASELCRRHPELLISRVQDSAFNQLLLVHDGPTGTRVQFGLTGGIKYETAGMIKQLEWPEVVAAHNAHAVLKRLEQETGWGIPPITPATTQRTLVYRVIAKLLAIGIDDRHTWHVVPAPVLVSDDDFATVWSLRELFPSLQPVGDRYLEAASALAEAADDGVTYWHEPLWTLLRDMEPVAVLDEAGVAHLPRTSPVDLMEAYDNVERDINPVVGFLLIKTAAANRLPSPELARPERNTEKFTTGESGFVAVQLLGGPLDQKKYGDVPVMSDGVPPLSIAIPLGKDPSEFATYVRLGLFDDLWRYAHQDDAEAPEEGTPMRPVKASQMIYVTNNFTRLFRYRSDRRWENERWDSTSGRWVGVGDYAHDKLFQADPNFDEISEDQARDHFPDAFNLEQ